MGISGVTKRNSGQGLIGYGLWLMIPLCLCLCVCARTEAEELRLNQIQVIGTHNSYHVRPVEPLFTAVRLVHAKAKTWDYTHAPLDVQLDRGVRSFELDLHHSAEGYRVYHAQLFDFGTTCRRFVDCLEVLRAWSAEHPRHVPIMMLLEIKDEPLAQITTPTLLIDAPALDRLDEEIRSVLSLDQLIVPDMVRGDAPTLNQAVRERGWPTLEASRGRFMFILHEGGAIRETYAKGRPSLEGRVMFTRSEEGRPDAAALVVDWPSVDRIQRLVREGYIVRTRADAQLRFDTSRREAALASGAQIVSTDYPRGEADEATGYVVELPGGVAARPNPVNVPTSSSLKEIEDPKYLETGSTGAP